MRHDRIRLTEPLHGLGSSAGVRRRQAHAGRSLHVRTLFQIPYVHLFEWWLLMQFHEQGFAGLPWQMDDDPIAVGQDLRDEIEESFDLIHQHAQLTAIGQAVVARMHQLVAEANARWRLLSRVATRNRMPGPQSVAAPIR
jgi:hypothetical protein